MACLEKSRREKSRREKSRREPTSAIGALCTRANPRANRSVQKEPRGHHSIPKRNPEDLAERKVGARAERVGDGDGVEVDGSADVGDGVAALGAVGVGDEDGVTGEGLRDGVAARVGGREANGIESK